MTMTVKLAPALELGLRQRSAALGRPASEIIREALQTYLDTTPAPTSTAFETGRDLFGKHAGTANLAKDRKALYAETVVDKQARRVKAAPRG
jgi:predicted transcriptional regulator